MVELFEGDEQSGVLWTRDYSLSNGHCRSRADATESDRSVWLERIVGEIVPFRRRPCLIRIEIWQSNMNCDTLYHIAVSYPLDAFRAAVVKLSAPE